MIALIKLNTLFFLSVDTIWRVPMIPITAGIGVVSNWYAKFYALDLRIWIPSAEEKINKDSASENTLFKNYVKIYLDSINDLF